MKILHINTEKTRRGGEQQLLYLVCGLKKRNITSHLICQPATPMEEKARVDLSIFRHSFLHLSSIKYRFMADHYIAISKKIKEVMVAEGIPGRRISVAHSGINLERFAATPVDHLIQEFNLAKDDPIIVNIAHLAWVKGQTHLIKAIPQVLDRVPNARFFIVGGGKLLAELQALASSLDIDRNLTFTGFRDDVGAFYQLADIVVMSSIQEGLDTAIIDALAPAKPVVASNAGGIPVPRAYAYFKMGTKSYFLSELLVDSMTLNDYLSSLTNKQEKRRAIIKFALWMKKIHAHQVRQRDFKSDNVLCENGNFFMIDLDNVKIGRLTDKQKVINLAQLNSSLSNMIPRSDRLRFFYHYATKDECSRNRRRIIYKKVWEISQTKNTKTFNLDLESL